MNKTRVIGGIIGVGSLASIGYGLYKMKKEKDLTEKNKSAMPKIAVGVGGVALLIGIFLIMSK